MKDRAAMLNKLRMYEFALLEAGLFLDTHPNDKNALEYFQKYNELEAQARKEYTAKYGPLSRRDFMGGDR